MSAFTIGIEQPPLKATLDVLDHGLDVYNARFSPAEHEEFAVTLKDGDGTLRGGIWAISWAGMLFVKWFWIDESVRRQGFGRKLLAAAEDAGREQGCTAAYLDTFEFQARPFYEKCGYGLFGTLDYPAGFKRYFLQKTL